MALEIDFVRDVAREHGYTEICHNQTSRMLSFRKSSTRINVYYTTKTVGTCLNHPKSGKTQLFRRNVDPLRLGKIFENPRMHTGRGYYKRKHITQKWKLEGSDNTFLNDSARRWQYVGMSSGMFGEYPEDVQVVMDICTKWDSLYWDDGDVPHLHKTNYACGSHGGLLRMMYRVMNDTCGICRLTDKDGKTFEGDDKPYDHVCDNMRDFLDDHGEDVNWIKRKMKSLSKDVRIELMQWLIGRDCCGLRFADGACDRIETRWSYILEDAHVEYGEMVYPKKAGLCSHCGVCESEGSD